MKNVWIWMRKKSFTTESEPRSLASNRFYLDWWIPYAVERCARARRSFSYHAYYCLYVRTNGIAVQPFGAHMFFTTLCATYARRSLSLWCHPDIVPKLSDGSLNHENFDARCGRVHLTLKRGCRRMHNNYNIYRNVLYAPHGGWESESHTRILSDRNACQFLHLTHTAPRNFVPFWGVRSRANATCRMTKDESRSVQNVMWK